MKYREINTLERFLDDVEAELLQEENRCVVSYPQNCISPWDADALDTANKELLGAVSGCANVYAIFTAPSNSSHFSLRYIGKTTRKLARQRIRNHLIKKNERTGAKLQDVTEHVLLGGQVKISWIEIQPESLRNYIEEELIHRHKDADWNRENA
ncbi:GIY-YIG catalytic domain-containing protein [Trichlorobacter thiogenes]|uniref:GIY-YIG catalytic domain-containing protein n=1 Tax=Trichlorobacter thiogenes TaxID=115783 RepID=A0A1T4PQ83_9BACT|nr:GIY-YIG nuclease family protein [Trichlorobacter thiogenes]SJZ93784.1 GIY-YIG catalytic domain-containing protein [Trichlorobacter thiogenes]